jgi:hypothetical protein
MGGWPAFWVAFIVLSAWTLYVDVRHDLDRRLARWWVARARSWGSLTGGRSFLLSTVALAVFSGVAWLADGVAEHAGNPMWALVVTGPAMLAYAPFVWTTMPAQAGAYALWRQDLAEAGADTWQQRAIAWWAGPPSLGGLVAIFLALWSVFVG